MPRFHFNIHDGVDLPDRTGTELEDWQVARLEAVRIAGTIFRDEARRIALGKDWRMEVTDETGLMLFRLDFSVMETAATMASRFQPAKQDGP